MWCFSKWLLFLFSALSRARIFLQYLPWERCVELLKVSLWIFGGPRMPGSPWRFGSRTCLLGASSSLSFAVEVFLLVLISASVSLLQEARVPCIWLFPAILEVMVIPCPLFSHESKKSCCFLHLFSLYLSFEWSGDFRAPSMWSWKVEVKLCFSLSFATLFSGNFIRKQPVEWRNVLRFRHRLPDLNPVSTIC